MNVASKYGWLVTTTISSKPVIRNVIRCFMATYSNQVNGKCHTFTLAITVKSLLCRIEESVGDTSVFTQFSRFPQCRKDGDNGHGEHKDRLAQPLVSKAKSVENSSGRSESSS